jgi:hypothetical protein
MFFKVASHGAFKEAYHLFD